jgi:hypothetical protein
MNYEFGSIIDCRKDPSIGHFVLTLGIDGKGRVMYYVITSRIYRAFEKLCNFFNSNCISARCAGRCFEHEFKEKDENGQEKKIIPVNLSDVFFLSQKIYGLHLTEDSMIVINSDPKTKDLKTFNELKKEGFVFGADTLSRADKQKLYAHIRTSANISRNALNIIGRNFNSLKIK